MAAYAEGLNILHHANAGKKPEVDAETAPLLRSPRYYQYQLNLAEITEVWRHGSVISSRLLDLTAAALRDGPDRHFAGRVSDSGEGRWTVRRPSTRACPRPCWARRCIRASRRAAADFADKLLSAMRLQFGGHEEKP